jgi:hypothetical protein
MLNVRNYVNKNNCLFLVTTKGVRPDGQMWYPYATKQDDFAVSRSGKSNDSKNRMSLDEFVKLLANPSIYPTAKVRCKPNGPSTATNAGLSVRDLDWEPLRRRLIEDGFGSLIA